MNKIIIATHNQGKLKEYKSYLEPLGYEVKSLNDYNISELEEPYNTFEENAICKAEYLSKQINEIVISDDSGICVNALKGRPGVFSARWVREGASDNENINHLWNELKKSKSKDTSAYYNTTIAIAFPNRETKTVSSKWNGNIIFEKKGNQGFSYDPIFYVKELNKTAAEMNVEEKNKYSQRIKAMKKAVKLLENY